MDVTTHFTFQFDRERPKVGVNLTCVYFRVRIGLALELG